MAKEQEQVQEQGRAAPLASTLGRQRDRQDLGWDQDQLTCPQHTSKQRSMFCTAILGSMSIIRG